MVRFMGVTEFQRRLRSVFSEVVERQVRVVLTRNGRPGAVLISYQEFQRLQAGQASEICSEFDRVWDRLARLNADVDEEELAADIEAARSEWIAGNSC